MFRVLRSLTIAIACSALVTGAVLADDPPTTPPPPVDPTDPHGVTLATPVEAVLTDSSATLTLLTWMVRWIIS
jgi:hypothetical protein